MAIDSAISNAWTEAAKDLGIRVVAPVELQVGVGRILQFEAHVLDFGSRSGAIATSENSLGRDRDDTRCDLRGLGHWFSELYPRYRVYDRQLFIDTLNDWQWYGTASAAPCWYTGKQWSE